MRRAGPFARRVRVRAASDPPPPPPPLTPPRRRLDRLRPPQLERNTASAAPMGPAANTVQASEPNSGLMTMEALRALAREKRRGSGGEG